MYVAIANGSVGVGSVPPGGPLPLEGLPWDHTQPPRRGHGSFHPKHLSRLSLIYVYDVRNISNIYLLSYSITDKVIRRGAPLLKVYRVSFVNFVCELFDFEFAFLDIVGMIGTS